MEYVRVIILAIIQALTEFLPVSSSGHLVFFQKVMGMQEANLFLDLILHLGTLLAVIIYFFRDLLNILIDGISATGELLQGQRPSDVMYRNPNLKLFIYVIIATIPAALAGVFLLKPIEATFDSFRFVGFTFLFTGLVVLLTKRFQANDGKNLNQLKFMDSVWIGIAQAVALLPGVSRSGMTISSGLFRGLDRDLAFRFSFIMSIPAVLGAFLLKLKDNWHEIHNGRVWIYLVGASVSFVLGLLVIKILSRIVIRGNFYLFAYYSFFIGILTLILSIWIK